jgi:hypothetical protein
MTTLVRHSAKTKDFLSNVYCSVQIAAFIGVRGLIIYFYFYFFAGFQEL